MNYKFLRALPVMVAALLLAACTQDDELDSIRLTISSKMTDTPEEVTVANVLKTPKIVFTPKQRMRDAANAMLRTIDRSCVTPVNTTKPGDGGSDDGSGDSPLEL